MLRDIDAYSTTLTKSATRGEGLCSHFGKKDPVRKNSKLFHCGAFHRSVLVPRKLPCPGKTLIKRLHSGIIYSFCKTLHLNCLTVF